MKELSILIPSRNEMFLKNTIEDALEHMEADTEIIALLDGKWADPAIEQHPRVNLIYVNKSVGQRAGANIAASLSKAKYVMKVDAHCAFEQGFDRKMIEGFKDMEPGVVMVPVMRNLWAFDWKCYHNYCGWKSYQGPTPEVCPNCGRSDKLRRKIMWIGKKRPQSTSYTFDSAPHFQYFGEYKKRDKYKEDKEKTGFTETMSLQGSCFMSTREDYWRLKLCDEEVGNWGNQGIEVACKAWLSGGRVLCNHNTWYAHMFRTQGGDFSFPWPNRGRDVRKTKSAVWDAITKGNLPDQKHSVKWLVERFWPVPGWTEEELNALS